MARARRRGPHRALHPGGCISRGRATSSPRSGPPTASRSRRSAASRSRWAARSSPAWPTPATTRATTARPTSKTSSSRNRRHERSGGSVKRILMVVVTTGLLAGLRQTPLHAQNADPAVTRRTVELTGGIWPGDFNGDGITDLASWHQLRLGNGDGTFRPATNITREGNLLAVGDFNRDGKLDAV